MESREHQETPGEDSEGNEVICKVSIDESPPLYGMPKDEQDHCYQENGLEQNHRNDDPKPMELIIVQRCSQSDWFSQA